MVLRKPFRRKENTLQTAEGPFTARFYHTYASSISDGVNVPKGGRPSSQ